MATTTRSGSETRLDTVQLLRALAALMIVVLHAEALVGLQAEARGLAFARLPALPLGAGVDLFFVISGFIIVFASERFFGAPGGAGEFLRRRLCRIVPLWWFALSLRIAILAAATLVGAGKEMPSAAAVAASYLFVPYDALGFGSAYPFPVLDLGWTLNYEMLFYALFACAIWLPRRVASLCVVAALTAAVLAATVVRPESTALRFWSNPIVLEFALGVGVALAFRAGLRLGLLARGLLAAGGLAIWLLVDLDRLGVPPGPGHYGWPRLLVYGGGAALILAAAVLGRTEFPHGALRRLSGLGDSSYALYLLHPFVILAARPVLARMPLSETVLWPTAVLVVAVAVWAAERVHRSLERPVVAWLQAARSGAAPWPGVRLEAPGPR